jgi:hypothetical protein
MCKEILSHLSESILESDFSTAHRIQGAGAMRFQGPLLLKPALIC